LTVRVMPHSRAARDIVAYTVSSSCRPVPAENAEKAPLCLCVLVDTIPSASKSQPPRHQDTNRLSLLHPRLSPYPCRESGLRIPSLTAADRFARAGKERTAVFHGLRSPGDHENAPMGPVFSRQGAKTPGIHGPCSFASFAALRESPRSPRSGYFQGR